MSAGALSHDADALAFVNVDCLRGCSRRFPAPLGELEDFGVVEQCVRLAAKRVRLFGDGKRPAGPLPYLADLAEWVLLVSVALAVMRLLAGPARADALARTRVAAP